MQMNGDQWALANFKRCIDNILGILPFLYLVTLALCIYGYTEINISGFS